MKTVNVNNYEAILYQEGEVQINIPHRVIHLAAEDSKGLKVYLTIAELKALLKLAEEV